MVGTGWCSTSHELTPANVAPGSSLQSPAEVVGRRAASKEDQQFRNAVDSGPPGREHSLPTTDRTPPPVEPRLPGPDEVHALAVVGEGIREFVSVGLSSCQHEGDHDGEGAIQVPGHDPDREHGAGMRAARAAVASGPAVAERASARDRRSNDEGSPANPVAMEVDDKPAFTGSSAGWTGLGPDVVYVRELFPADWGMQVGVPFDRIHGLYR